MTRTRRRRARRRAGGLVLCCLLLPALLPAADAGPAGGTGPFAPATIQLDFANGLLRRNLFPEAVEEYSAFLERFPDDPRAPGARFRRGEAHFAQDAWREAAEDYYAYLTTTTDPDHRDVARLRYGICLYELGYHRNAVVSFGPLVEDPAGGERHRAAAFYTGLAERARDNADAALGALALVTEGELAPRALFARAEVRAGRGEHAEAAALFGEFLGNFPEHELARGARLRRAEELRRAGRLDEAADAFAALLPEDSDGSADDDAARARYGLAWVRYGQERYGEARTLAEEVLAAADPDIRSGAAYLAGLAAYRHEDFADAARRLAEVADGPYADAARRQRGWALLAAGEADEALAAAEALRREQPADAAAETDYLAGRALALKEEWASAIVRFRAVLATDSPFEAAAMYDLAFAFDRAGRPADAAEAYAAFLEAYPDHPRALDALLGQAGALQRAESWAAALAVYERILGREDAPERLKEHALNREALSYYHLRQYANMRAAYQRLIENHPGSGSVPEALYWLAWYESEEKRYNRAADYYRDLIERFPDHARADRARYRRAMTLGLAGEEDAAADLLLDILRNHPRIDVEQKEMLWLGSHLQAEERFAEADEVYERLLAEQPGGEIRATTLYSQAEARRLREDWDGALEKYRTFLTTTELLAENGTLEPDRARALRNVGLLGKAICHRERGEVDPAREALAGIRLPPDDPLVMDYLFELGRVQLAGGDLQAAGESLLRVGLLYDDPEVCGEALWLAGRAYEESARPRKARICYAELAGEGPDSYGIRFPDSPYTERGREALQRLESAPPSAETAPGRDA
jgi:TolA-binding protein